jgi:hypothetical protein
VSISQNGKRLQLGIELVSYTTLVLFVVVSLSFLKNAHALCPEDQK